LDRAQELLKAAIDEHTNHNTAELDRIRSVKKRAARRGQVSEQMAVNMHTMGTSLVRKVRDVRQMADIKNGEDGGDIVEPRFQARVREHETTGTRVLIPGLKLTMYLTTTEAIRSCPWDRHANPRPV